MPFCDIIGHERSIAAIKSALKHGRLAHAYLFHGEAHIGKFLSAVRLAQALSCEDSDSIKNLDSCGICRSCLQIAARTYPDYAVIEPDRELAVPQIKIEQIREIEQQLIYRPLIGEKKICIIDDADRLTIGAANALLKTLEEPPPYGLFILVSSRPMALPATIRSRCQSLRFLPPAFAQVEAALILKRRLPPADARFLALCCDGRIGEALAQDLEVLRAEQCECLSLVDPSTLSSITAILSAAETLAKNGRGSNALNWLGRWIRDLIFVLVGGDPEHLLHRDRLDTLTHYAKRGDLDVLLEISAEIDRIEQQAARHPNMQMALETVLLRLRDALGPSRPPAPVAPMSGS
ncbi:MAG: DNA polymerase III subunit delta' [Nitrospira sp.]|nr:DNA polymerase III subunit delta' [Nitrospira sp.]